MELNLHANATTTPKIRAYIQQSTKSVAKLAKELGKSETTIRRWKGRDSVKDRSHRPHKLSTTLSDLEERLIVELRSSLWLSLDDLTEVMKRCVNETLSRSAIHRCLQRHGISKKPKAAKEKSGTFETDQPLGFIHLDLKYLRPLHRQKAYVFVAIDRASRFVYAEIHQDRKAATARDFLARFLAVFPYQVHTILTDNGSEFTDRFAPNMIDKPEYKPSGNHLIDKLCEEHKIKHKLTRPYRPQTNGMVERFNRRIGEHLAARPSKGPSQKHRFESHEEREAYILDFIANYNRTRLRCLNYKAPLETLSNLTGHNTKATTPLMTKCLKKPGNLRYLQKVENFTPTPITR